MSETTGDGRPSLLTRFGRRRIALTAAGFVAAAAVGVAIGVLSHDSNAPHHGAASLVEPPSSPTPSATDEPSADGTSTEASPSPAPTETAVVTTPDPAAPTASVVAPTPSQVPTAAPTSSERHGAPKPSPSAGPSVYRGLAVDSAGSPLAGILVIAGVTNEYGTYPVSTALTGADGTFAVPCSTPIYLASGLLGRMLGRSVFPDVNTGNYGFTPITAPGSTDAPACATSVKAPPVTTAMPVGAILDIHTSYADGNPSTESISLGCPDGQPFWTCAGDPQPNDDGDLHLTGFGSWDQSVIFGIGECPGQITTAHLIVGATTSVSFTNCHPDPSAPPSPSPSDPASPSPSATPTP